MSKNIRFKGIAGCVSGIALLFVLVFAIGLTSCSKSPAAPAATTPPADPVIPPGYVFITGNWEFQPTSSGTSVPFTLLSGFINEQGYNPSVSDFTTAALQVQSTHCFSTSPDIALEGAVANLQVTLDSFSVGGQQVTIKATKDASGTHLTGTYSVSGGCADGSNGAIAGTLYSPLSGTYAGPITGSTTAQSVQLALTQYGQGTGSGQSFVTGSAVFRGFSCFSKGTLDVPNGFVLGSAASFTLKTDEVAGSQVVVKGSFDPAADLLNLTSINVVGGSCSGAISGAVLVLQK